MTIIQQMKWQSGVLRKWAILAIAGIVVVIFFALSNGLAGTHCPFPIKNSGLLFGKRNIGGSEQIYWLDNEHALFPAYAVESETGPDGKKVLTATPPGIYVWDVANNTYIRHANLQQSNWFMCFNDGFIAYSIGSSDIPVKGSDKWDKQKIMMAGQLGHERQLPLDIMWRNQPELKQCYSMPHSNNHGLPKNTIYGNLRPQDGYIYDAQGQGGAGNPITVEDFNKLVKLYRPGNSKPIVLPILVKEMGRITYSRFAQKYLLIPHTWRAWNNPKIDRGWPPNISIPIYLISPNGTVNTITIPPGTWFPARVFMTKLGLFWISDNAPNGNSRQAGGWLLRDGKVIKLFDHLVDAAGVSPDGCNIVYANNDFNPKTTEYTQVIELCGPKNRE